MGLVAGNMVDRKTEWLAIDNKSPVDARDRSL
jgi:hypothetical protein